MKQYLVLSSQPWLAVPTRTQQIITRLKGAEILFFEPAHGNARSGNARKMRQHLTVYTLPRLPFPPLWAGRLLRSMWKRQAGYIAKIAATHDFHQPLLWATDPEQVHVLDFLSCKALIYDCAQYWPNTALQWEGDLAAAADVVFAASPGLIDRLSPCNGNIALLPNGVNFPMFARGDEAPPRELSVLPWPILGWVGAITPGLNLAPIEYAARRNPLWQFALVGHIGENVALADLQRLENVHFLGARPMAETPDYIRAFDLCLDLRRQGAEDCGDVIPRRIYEYLSSGLPIVTQLYPDEVEAFPDVIYGAHSPQEYEALCVRALAEDKTWVQERRRDCGAAAAWTNRASEVTRILESIGL